MHPLFVCVDEAAVLEKELLEFMAMGAIVGTFTDNFGRTPGALEVWPPRELLDEEDDEAELVCISSVTSGTAICGLSMLLATLEIPMALVVTVAPVRIITPMTEIRFFDRNPNSFSILFIEIIIH